MIRRINNTVRLIIPNKDVSLKLLENENGSLYFKTELKLAKYKFEQDSRVYLEGWRSNAVQIWELGTVSQPKELTEAERTLRSIPPNSKFVLKVVAQDGSGVLFGKSNHIVPKQPKGNAHPILPVIRHDIGEEVWRLDFNHGDQVHLFVNDSITNIEQAIASDPASISLIFPAIFRSILQHAILVDKVKIDDIENEKWTEWIELAQYYADTTEFPEFSKSDQDYRIKESLKWVEQMVEAFSRHTKINARERYQKIVDK